MRKEYKILANNLLFAYHSKVMNLKAATAVAPQVREASHSDYAFRLSIGLEGLLTVANAAADGDSSVELETLIAQCNSGIQPIPSSW